MTKGREIAVTAVAVLLLAALCLAIAPVGKAVSVSDFTDVSSSAWYYDAVAYVTAKGLFTGTTGTTFTPGGGMTRGMFIAVLGRYAGVDPDDWKQGTIRANSVALHTEPSATSATLTMLKAGAVITLEGKSGDWYKITSASVTGYVPTVAVTIKYHVFTDVDYAYYYAGYAVWAYENEIVNGMGSSDVFAPGMNVTREQLCSLLNRYADAAGLTLTKTVPAATFTDSSSISSWAKADVEAMQRSGVVNGNTAGAFQPKNSASRAEAAAMFQRFDAAAHGMAVPTAKPSPTPTPTPTPSPTPSPSPTPPGSLPADSPATPVGGTVSVPATMLRVGLLVSTQNFDSCVQTVKMENLSGGGFSFGAMGDDRKFISSQRSTSSGTITITTDGYTFTVKDSAGAQVYSGQAPMAIHPLGSHPLTRLNGEYRYFGDFELRQAAYKSGHITVINFVEIEDYVKGVIPFEISNMWPAETLKVTAVASRTQIMSTVNSTAYRQYGMDVVALDNTQLYRGRGITYSESYFKTTDAAAEATAGMYLTYDGKLCITAFSSCNGGQIKSSKEVFGVEYPYLIEKADPYEQAAAGEIANYSDRVEASHRVGLSQWGSYAMAKYYHKDYQTILGFYFPGTHLQHGAY